MHNTKVKESKQELNKKLDLQMFLEEIVDSVNAISVMMKNDVFSFRRISSVGELTDKRSKSHVYS